MKYLVLLFLLTILQGCKNGKNNIEDPFTVAKSYCNCLENQLKNAKDSSVNLNDCAITQYSKSRFMTIYLDFDNRMKYNRETIDSATKFSIKVRDIEDSLCYNKIDFKKVKKMPHINL